MADKLIITSQNGGFTTQLERDGNLIGNIEIFDCSNMPSVDRSNKKCPDTQADLYLITDNSGSSSAFAAADCFILDGNPILAVDLLTFLDTLCPLNSVVEPKTSYLICLDIGGEPTNGVKIIYSDNSCKLFSEGVEFPLATAYTEGVCVIECEEKGSQGTILDWSTIK